MSQKDFIMKQLFLILLLYSTGVMSQNTAINTGINTKNPGSRLTVNGSFAGDYKIVSGDITLDDSDFYIAFNSPGGKGSILLPKAISGPGNFKGRIYGIKNISAQGDLTVFPDASNSEKIDAAGDVDYIVVPPGYYAELISKGTTTGTTWELSMLVPTKLSSKMTRLLNVAIGVPKDSGYQSLFAMGSSSLDVEIPGSRGSFSLMDDKPTALFLNFTVGLALLDYSAPVFPPGSVISYYRCELFINDMPTGIFQVVQENSKGLQFNLSGKYNFVSRGWRDTIHARISTWNSFGSANNYLLGVLSVLLSVDRITRT
jgi:hypothetical protein